MLSTSSILLIIGGYFAVLVLIGRLTSKSGDNDEFFKANNSSPWYLVAFGMVGVSLSGVTFLSVPGSIKTNSFSYLQMVLGNVLGYWLIIFILLPLYYKMNLTSIYSYLGTRFGRYSQKTGSFFFLLSRTIGASLRLYLVAIVLQEILFAGRYNVPFALTVAVVILLIWIYTYRGGIKTIVWTDTLQTSFMLLGLVAFLFWVSGEIGGFSVAMEKLEESKLSQVFFFEASDGRFFWKSFLTGIGVALVMNGLDQDMMQKNLTCRSLSDAKKNLFALSMVFLAVTALFVLLGGFMTVYADQVGITATKDKLFVAVAQAAPVGLFIIFLLGVIAAAYSSADSALTSLTTSFCVDFLKMDELDEQEKVRIRKTTHVIFSIILFATILIFKSFNDDSVMWALFKAAGLTYGPLLGMYAFGLFLKRFVKDKFVPYICVFSTVMAYLAVKNLGIGFEILLYNGALTLVLMLIFSSKEKEEEDLL